jgi:hypothetical protein
MASWAEVEAQAPELAARARTFFDAFTHKTLATLRKDGAPRISGSECEFSDDGQLYIGSMWMAVKAQDLRRDPRYALHSGSPDPDKGWQGDAKVAGRVEEVTAPGADSHRFRLDISELVVIGLNEERTKMVVEAWHEGRGVSRLER